MPDLSPPTTGWPSLRFCPTQQIFATRISTTSLRRVTNPTRRDPGACAWTFAFWIPSACLQRAVGGPGTRRRASFQHHRPPAPPSTLCFSQTIPPPCASSRRSWAEKELPPCPGRPLFRLRLRLIGARAGNTYWSGTLPGTRQVAPKGAWI